jgi:phosphate-selective porin OprO/OprP
MRFTYAYKFKKNHLLSVGSAFMNRSMNGESVSYKQGSESQYMNNKYVSVKIKDVDTTMKKNIEALYINDKYSLQAEYTMIDVNAKKDNYNFYAIYLQGSYFIIGNGSRYKFSNSTLVKPKLNRDGALEVAFRYSYIDLNDKDETGGTQKDYTYGVNWYYNNELKFMFNYIVAEPKGTDDYDGRLQILQARALFSF